MGEPQKKLSALQGTLLTILLGLVLMAGGFLGASGGMLVTGFWLLCGAAVFAVAYSAYALFRLAD